MEMNETLFSVYDPMDGAALQDLLSNAGPDGGTIICCVMNRT